MSAIRVPLSEPRYSPTEPANVQTQIVFTRQLWERTMPTADIDDTSSSSPGISNIGPRRSRRPSSAVPAPVHTQPSPTHSTPSEAPLTPEESPPFRSSRKRSADALEQDDSFEVSASHARDNSGDSSVSFCLCQPEPKVPRPRNAFILYRQNRQAAVVAHNPGLANPEISKIIGEQWHNEPNEEKNRWKAYAEEEKLKHQQKYPLYRYQPKRAGRRTSVSSDTGPLQLSDVRNCPKCGGRSISHPVPGTPSSAKERFDRVNSTETSPSATHLHSIRTNSFQLPPPTPSSTTTPSTRYLPMLNNLSLSSPHVRRMAQGRPFQSIMSSQRSDEERSAPLTPDAKRRRFESPQGTYVMSTRVMPPRHSAGPGTPFPFTQQQPSQQQQQLSQTSHQPYGPPPQQQAPYAMPNVRRESLPPATDLLRGRANTLSGQANMMGPPPRPGPGYSQHRLSQGHVRGTGGELSLTLPPLQTVGVAHGPSTGRQTSTYGASGTRRPSESAREPERRGLGQIIMSIPFQHKIGILRRITPPLAQSSVKSGRACVIAVEGDDAEAAKRVTEWLEECLAREDDLLVKVIDGPKPVNVASGTELQVPDLFQTVIDWHSKNKEIIDLVRQGGSNRKDSANTASTKATDESSEGGGTGEQPEISTEDVEGSLMDIDEHSNVGSSATRVVILFRTYTLTASNFYASGIPIKDVYRPDDHWQWTATLWRGIIGPDLTIYIKDVDCGDAARDEGGKGGVEIVEEAKMHSKFMAVRRMKNGDGRSERNGLEGIEAGTLRRLGFEVGEWIRGASQPI